VGDLPAAGPVTVDQPTPASALAIGAHPDDIEFGCGATLAKWAAAGCRVHHLVLTDGSKGSWDRGADLGALVAVREAECRSAAQVIDGHAPPHRVVGGPDRSGRASEPDDRVLFLRRIDGELENAVEERREVARIIRRLRPDALVGHDPWRRYRLHPDHRAAGFLTLDALVAARDPHFFPELGLEPHRPGSLLLFEADLPNHVEDVRGLERRKVEALLCHTSQFESTMGISAVGRSTGPITTDEDRSELDDGSAVFTAKVLRQLAEHGSLARVAAAEAFHRITAL
jgi:LmbE family N-acetylglucosaminyl deacetylase